MKRKESAAMKKIRGQPASKGKNKKADSSKI
jgi:hypothetical protein